MVRGTMAKKVMEKVSVKLEFTRLSEVNTKKQNTPYNSANPISNKLIPNNFRFVTSIL